MPAIEANELEMRFDGVRALDGLSLSVESGELFGFLGPNGAGKTTTISILTGQLLPDSGTATVLGTDPGEEPVETRRRVGILPERETPPSFLTPREYFHFVGDVRGLGGDLVDRRVAQWADRLAFHEKLDTLNTDLSRGQQQKVMITQAFLHEPELVFIDEPLVNLDPIIQERLKGFLTDYRHDGHTVFLSTHHIEVAETLCTRVGIVHEGRLIDERDPRTLAADESLLDAFLEHVEGEASGAMAGQTGAGAADEGSTDSGEGSTDSGEVSTDSGEVSTDSGEVSTDSGEGSTDSGEGSTDSGEVSTDSGGVGTE